MVKFTKMPVFIKFMGYHWDLESEESKKNMREYEEELKENGDIQMCFENLPYKTPEFVPPLPNRSSNC